MNFIELPPLEKRPLWQHKEVATKKNRPFQTKAPWHPAALA